MSNETKGRMDLRVLEPGNAVAGAVCLRSKATSVTKAGKPFLKIELANHTGTIAATIWSEGMAVWENLEVGVPLQVEGSIKEGWNGGQPELVVTSVRPLPRPHDVELELNPFCPVPLDQLRERFTHILEHMQPAGRELVHVVLEHVGEADWWTAPAAKAHHHACIGGLAWHSIEVAEVALSIARSTPAASVIDRNALLVGALLHDVGKVREYQWRGVPIDLSPTGRLTYHTCSGSVLTTTAVERSRARLAEAGVTELDVMHLCHVQVSHHGTKEFGSPIEPSTPEAAIVHHADNVSAKLRSMLDSLEAAPCDKDGWVRPSGWGRRPILSLLDAPRQALIGDGGEPMAAGAIATMEQTESEGSRVVLRVHPAPHHTTNEEGI